METENDVRLRVLDAIEKGNITINELAGRDNAVRMAITRQLKQGATLTVDTVLRLLNKFPAMSANYLMRGRSVGLSDDAFKQKEQLTRTIIQPSESDLDLLAAKQRIAELEYTIDLQKHRIEQLEREGEKNIASIKTA